MRNRATPGDVVPEAQVAGTGFERKLFLQGNRHIDQSGGAKSGAPDASDPSKHPAEHRLAGRIEVFDVMGDYELRKNPKFLNVGFGHNSLTIGPHYVPVGK